jgi:hypothetical protein
MQRRCRRNLLWRWGSFSATNPSRSEEKLAYVTLNTQTPCPPRSAVPVNTGAWLREFVSPQHARFAFGHVTARLVLAFIKRSVFGVGLAWISEIMLLSLRNPRTGLFPIDCSVLAFNCLVDHVSDCFNALETSDTTCSLSAYEDLSL